MDGSVDFYRNWANYKLGFGDVNAEHWLGNEKIHYLTNLQVNELRVDLEAANNERTYAHYSEFKVASENDGYRIATGAFLGTSIAGWYIYHYTYKLIKSIFKELSAIFQCPFTL